ncbi:MAG: zinc carboxypeptidase, partial [Polaribacter sp.]|nr:zinc carboxypeptidase [Polaribacter sp.]
MKFKSLLLLTFLTLSNLFSQEIKSPSEFLGYEIGTRFTRHHKVVDYFLYLSQTVPNVKLEKYGETNEHRPLYLATISSEKNSTNLEKIRQDNLAQAGILNGNQDNKIAIVWLSYN